MSRELKNKLKIIKDNLDFLSDNYFVQKIGIFGSLVKGKYTKQSDIDVLVSFSQPVGFFRFIELEIFLSKVLQKKVDLATKKALKPTIKKQILKETIYV